MAVKAFDRPHASLPRLPFDLRSDHPLVRGEQLYNRNCAVCHGPKGQGDGPVTQFWKADAKRPANLTEQRIGQQTDGALYVTMSQGFGTMPPLRENMTVRERWDVVNYVRNLSK
jgi:mono/diheme cytochrome c family protein